MFGSQKISFGDPDITCVLGLARVRLFVGRHLFGRVGNRLFLILDTIENLAVVRMDLQSGWIKAQCRIRDFEDVFAFVDLKRQVGCHARHQFHIGVRCFDNHRIRNDVLLFGTAHSNLNDLALVKEFVRISVDGESHDFVIGFGFLNHSDVRFVDRGVYVHPLFHLRGDDKHLRCLKLRSKRLPNIDLFLDNDPIAWR